jgi:RNA polymerase sigma-70 factor (ECF subfamily)
MTIEPARVAMPEEAVTADGQSKWPIDFDEIYRAEMHRLTGFFIKKVGNREDALDLAHEALTRFLNAEQPRSIFSPGKYLTRIAVNLIRDRRKRGSTKLSALCDPLDRGLEAIANDDPLREIESRQELDHWRVVLDRLPQLTLDIFVLNRVEGYSYSEVARILDIPIWRVQKHMLKAIRHVQAQLDCQDA